MNREIKFRIWDGEDMVYPDQYFNFSNAVFWNIKTTSVKKIKLDTLNQQYLMQFTGLTDKNGKEIYEGDIIEFKVNPSFYVNAKLGDRYIIEYYGAGFFMKPINWVEKIKAQNYIGLLPPYQTSNMRNHYEVIGNIYDNPELCKQLGYE